MIYGYARVSSTGQDLAQQLAELGAAGCTKIYQEKVSGGTAERPQLKRAIGALDAGDVLMVTATDRLARNTRDLLNILHAVKEAGAGFRSIAEPMVDTTSQFAEVIIAVLGVAASYERHRITERTTAGRVQAKARGVKFGRRAALTPHQQAEALQRLAAGDTQRTVAALLGVDQATISRLYRRGGLNGRLRLRSGRAAIDLREGFADVQTMLLVVATTARTFLLPHWSRWHQVWGPPLPTVASQWTCVRSSIFLIRALHRCGIEARLQSGQPPKQALGVIGEDCGVFTADGWMGHAWVEANGFVVDITADQFGHAPVVVAPASDLTYRPARDEAYSLTPTRNGMVAIDEIWPSWCSYVDQQGRLIKCNSGMLEG